jgi:hypothetical protein
LGDFNWESRGVPFRSEQLTDPFELVLL